MHVQWLEGSGEETVHVFCQHTEWVCVCVCATRPNEPERRAADTIT